MKNVKKEIKKLVRRVVVIGAGLSCMMQIAWAENSVTAGVSNLFTLVATIISSVGGILILFGAVTLGMAFKKRDPAGKDEGIWSIVGGLVIAAAPWVVQQLI